MNKYAIVTDSASDLCKEYREANGIDYAQTMMSWKKEDGQNIETGASLDWDFISYKDLITTCFIKSPYLILNPFR